MSEHPKYKPVGQRFGPKRERPSTPESGNSSDDGLSEVVPKGGHPKRVFKEGDKPPKYNHPRVVFIEQIIIEDVVKEKPVAVVKSALEKKEDNLEETAEEKKEETVDEKQDEAPETADQPEEEILKKDEKETTDVPKDSDKSKNDD